MFRFCNMRFQDSGSFVKLPYPILYVHINFIFSLILQTKDFMIKFLKN